MDGTLSYFDDIFICFMKMEGGVLLKIRLETITQTIWKRFEKKERKKEEKNRRTNRTGFIRWRTGFVRRRTGFILSANEASLPAEEASWLANEASPPANEASPFGLVIFTKLASSFINCLFPLFFHALKGRKKPL